SACVTNVSFTTTHRATAVRRLKRGIENYHDRAEELDEDSVGGGETTSSSSNSDSDSDYNPDETVDTLDESTIADSESPVPDTVIAMIPASLDTEQAPSSTSIIVELPSSLHGIFKVCLPPKRVKSLFPD
ncbi:hypothetical protein ElyMa_003726400, partial [Elysia marginata]